MLYNLNSGANKIILYSKYFLSNCLLLIILFFIAIGPSYADPITDIHSNLDEKSGDSECIRCHSSHQELRPTVPLANTINNLQTPQTQNILSSATTGVIGNITLITGMGQNWYQQGINALGTKTWGWTFFDETINSSGYITPPEQTTQRNNIYALLLDSGNNSTPIKNAQVTANITYWMYDGVNYTNNTVQINLTEDPDHNGFYNGVFYFSGNSKAVPGCSYCHAMHGQNTPQVGNFPGNYTGIITAQADNKKSTEEISFEVTPWGCEDCHGSANPHKAGLLVLGEACYICHGINQMARHNDAGNPHQSTPHRNISCTDCHTSKSLDTQTFNGVTFITGGINNNKSVPEYNYTLTQLNGGAHTNLTCIDCHDDLTLPTPQGSFKEDNYTVKNTVNNYTPGFAGVQRFQDYYIINVSSGGPLNVTLDWEGTSNIGFYVYPPDFNPLNGTPYYNGSTFTNKPEMYNNSLPFPDKWILAVYGYDLLPTWKGIIQLPLNYTLNSTFPILQKNLPRIPECNSCHNLNGAGKAFTADRIPDWNPGFSHVDTNNDGAPDIQCRMCHDAMHSITIKDCHNCHPVAAVNHPVKEPIFTQYTSGQCLECHGDPHEVTSAGGTDCIACHNPADVNISLFGRHANINYTDGAGNTTNNDCWTCHYQKDMDRDHVHLCDSCHLNSSGIVHVTDPSLIKGDFMHGMTTCKVCHAPETYHLNGSVGPLGVVENVLLE